MIKQTTVKAKPRIKPRRSSWHTYRRLRCLDTRTGLLVSRRLDEALAAVGQLWFDDGARIYLPDDVFNALVVKLERHTLPFARYDQWCAHGNEDAAVIMLSSVLMDCGILDERGETLAASLLAIEPFPSKKPVDRFKFHQVLAKVGDVWSEYRRVEHQLSVALF